MQIIKPYIFNWKAPPHFPLSLISTKRSNTAPNPEKTSYGLGEITELLLKMMTSTTCKPVAFLHRVCFLLLEFPTRFPWLRVKKMPDAQEGNPGNQNYPITLKVTGTNRVPFATEVKVTQLRPAVEKVRDEP